MGNSKGIADVEYEKAEDATLAIKEYDGAELYGKTLIVISKSSIIEADDEKIAPRFM